MVVGADDDRAPRHRDRPPEHIAGVGVGPLSSADWRQAPRFLVKT